MVQVAPPRSRNSAKPYIKIALVVLAFIVYLELHFGVEITKAVTSDRESNGWTTESQAIIDGAGAGGVDYDAEDYVKVFSGDGNEGGEGDDDEEEEVIEVDDDEEEVIEVDDDEEEGVIEGEHDKEEEEEGEDDKEEEVIEGEDDKEEEGEDDKEEEGEDGDDEKAAVARGLNVTDDKQTNVTLPSKEKLIKPGEHARIPPPEKRIGPNGEVGYVHDPKFLLKNPRKFQIAPADVGQVCAPPGEGVEYPAGAKNLKNIRHHMETSKASRDVKLFCTVYTYTNKTYNTDVISETWGKKCDGLLYASDVSNAESGHMHMPSLSRHGFEYSSMVQRMRAIFAYLYDNFLDDYDFFHFSGDDTYLLIENMKEFLASDKVKEWEEVPDQYFIGGFWMNWPMMKIPKGEFYFGGGSGYTLSRKALKAHVEGPLQVCDLKTDNGMEDFYFSSCVRRYLTQKYFDTRDEFGAHRYHQVNITMHSSWPESPQEFNWGIWTRAVIPKSLKHMEEAFGFPYVVKEKYISNSSVAFHWHNLPWNMKRMEMLLYKDTETEPECNK